MTSVRSLLCGLVVLFAGLDFAMAENQLKTITSVSEIRSIPPGDTRRRKVDLHGQIRLVNPSSGFFLFEGSHGIFIQLRKGGPKLDRSLPLGTMVRITGKTQTSYYLPLIVPEKIEVVGTAPITTPLKITEQDFDKPELDCRWVTFDATIANVREVSNRSGEYLYIDVKLGKHETEVRFPWGTELFVQLDSLTHRRVNFTGVVASYANNQRQLLGRFFIVQSGDFIKLNEELPLKPVPIQQLLRAGGDPSRGARVVGTVIHISGNQVFLRSGKGNLKVVTVTDSNFERGDVVEVAGQVEPDSFSPVMMASEVKVLEKRGAPEPKLLDLNLKTFPAKMNYELGRCDAQLVAVQDFDGELTLRCKAQGRFFDAFLYDQGEIDRSDLQPGCMVSLVGITKLGFELKTPTIVKSSTDLKLYLRDWKDLKITQSAPWWSFRKLVIGLLLIVSVAFLVFMWGLSLRTRVRKQTGLISAQIERQAILDERQRLARVLHDTLQQNMTGIALQLEAADRKLSDSGRAKERLDVARELLEQCREQGRVALTELRSTHSVGRSLEESLDHMLFKEASLSKVELDVETVGESFRLSDEVFDNVAHIVEEAVRNALRHANATEIKVYFEYSEDLLVARVVDNGDGVDLNQDVPEGHFGIIGMEERAAQISAEFKLRKLPKGTAVYLSLAKPEILEQ